MPRKAPLVRLAPGKNRCVLAVRVEERACPKKRYDALNAVSFVIRVNCVSSTCPAPQPPWLPHRLPPACTLLRALRVRRTAVRPCPADHNCDARGFREFYHWRRKPCHGTTSRPAKVQAGVQRARAFGTSTPPNLPQTTAAQPRVLVSASAGGYAIFGPKPALRT